VRAGWAVRRFSGDNGEGYLAVDVWRHTYLRAVGSVFVRWWVMLVVVVVVVVWMDGCMCKCVRGAQHNMQAVAIVAEFEEHQLPHGYLDKFQNRSSATAGYASTSHSINNTASRVLYMT